MAKKPKKDRRDRRHVPRTRETVKLRYEPWRLKSAFDPLLDIVTQLEREHTINVQGEEDQPVFLDLATGKWHDTPAALLGFIELFELFETRFGQQLPLEPLRVLHTKMTKAELIDNRDTRAVRESATALYNACLDTTIAQMDELVQDYKLREALNGNIVD